MQLNPTCWFAWNAWCNWCTWFTWSVWCVWATWCLLYLMQLIHLTSLVPWCCWCTWCTWCTRGTWETLYKCKWPPSYIRNSNISLEPPLIHWCPGQHPYYFDNLCIIIHGVWQTPGLLPRPLIPSPLSSHRFGQKYISYMRTLSRHCKPDISNLQPCNCRHSGSADGWSDGVPLPDSCAPL